MCTEYVRNIVEINLERIDITTVLSQAALRVDNWYAKTPTNGSMKYCNSRNNRQQVSRFTISADDSKNTL